MTAKVVQFYGLGGAIAEWWANGERLLLSRFQAKGVDAVLLNWDQRQEAYNFMKGFAGPKAYIGDSLGAGSAAQYPGDLGVEVAYSGGFQPSMDDSRATKGLITVASSVVKAHAIYDSVWYDTLGLGQAEYEKTPGAKTIVMNTNQRSAHPDDWGPAQDMIFDEALKALGVS